MPILLIDDQSWSFDELEERSIRVQQAVVALGVNVVNGGTDITRGGKLEVGVSRTSGYRDAEVAAILAALPEDLRSDVEITVIDPPIDALLCDVAATEPSASPAASTLPSAAPSSAATAACLDLPLGWGPLAVVDDPAIGGLDAGVGPGRLSIGARCVTLRGGRGPGVTLVWRAGDTRWDPATREILFVDRDLGLIRLSDGDRMTLGGFTPETGEAPDQGGPVLAPWIAMPDDACPDDLWEVNDVSRLRGR